MGPAISKHSHPLPAEVVSISDSILTVNEVDLRRRSELLRQSILGLIPLVALYLIYYVVFSPLKLIGPIILFIATLPILGIAYWLNSRRTPLRVAASAATVLVWMDLAAVGLSAARPGGVHADALSITGLFLVATIGAGTLISANASIWFAMLGSLLTIITFLLLPQGDDLKAVLQQRGPAIVVSEPIIIQCLLTLLVYVGVRGLRQAYQAVDRAQELQAAYDRLAAQKAELEADIYALQEVYTRAANGDLNARAHLEDRLLWPVGQSLNRLLERLGRAQQRYGQLEDAINALGEALERGQMGQPWALPALQGTAVDRLIKVLRAP